VKNYLEKSASVKLIHHIDVQMDHVLANHSIVLPKLSVQLIDQLNVMMEHVNNQMNNAINKLHVQLEKKDVLMDHVNHY
jgi:hypothetical protein